MNEIVDNLCLVRERIGSAAVRAGRDPGDVLLVAVTKTRSAVEINEAIDAGVCAIGENRIQEAVSKWPDLRDGPERHMIGRLQRNKAGRAVELFDRIQSVDRLELAEALSRRAVEAGKELPVLLEVNISGEETKTGIEPGTARSLLERIAPLPGITPDGLMTIGPLTPDRGAIRDSFRRMKELFEELKARPVEGAPMRHLSIGMSDDFEIAVEEGATMVRVGTAIFGPRKR